MKPIKVKYLSGEAYNYATMIDVVPSGKPGNYVAILSTGRPHVPFVVVQLGVLELDTRGGDTQELKPHEQKNMETVLKALNAARNGLETITELRATYNIHRQARNTIDNIDHLMGL